MHGSEESVGPVLVEIVGAPVACAGGVKDTWREVALWAARQLESRYGDAVSVRYFDLFDPGCPQVPDGVELPLVLVQGEVVTSGSKVSVPAIRARLHAIGVRPGNKAGVEPTGRARGLSGKRRP